MKLQFWDYEHEKTLSVSYQIGNDDCELVMLDNEFANYAIGSSSSEPDTNSKEKKCGCSDGCGGCDSEIEDITDSEVNDLQIEVDEVELPNPVVDNTIPLDGEDDGIDEVDDVDLELEQVEFEDDDNDNDVAQEVEEEIDIIEDISNEYPNIPDIMADDTGTGIKFNNMKDLLSMLFTMSMATDSESIINAGASSVPNSSSSDKYDNILPDDLD